MKRPFVSVIILNYQGEKIIERTVKSVLSNTYPKSLFEVIVVDNASTDGSLKILHSLAKSYAQVRIIPLPKNLGFSGGNNAALRAVKGKYAVLLNNDCVVESKWLKSLVERAESDNEIFSVGSKVLFYPKFSILKIQILSHIRLEKVELVKSSLTDLSGKPLSLLFVQERHQYRVVLPSDPAEKEVTVRFLLRIDDDFPNLEELGLSPEKAVTQKVEGNLWEVYYRVRLNSQRKDKVQNAGIVLFQDGHGRDRGAVVRDAQQNYEDDLGQYEKMQPVLANCGAAVLYNMDIMRRIGFLNEAFFLYYEDAEIGVRAIKGGYKNIYEPKAVVRHLHAFSSHEGSNFFLYHAERGRLLNLLLHFPLHVFVKEFTKFGIFAMLICLRSLGRGDIQATKLLVCLNILFSAPWYWRPNPSRGKFYRRVLAGEWFLGKYE